jgi:hypothetical protein
MRHSGALSPYAGTNAHQIRAGSPPQNHKRGVGTSGFPSSRHASVLRRRVGSAAVSVASGVAAPFARPNQRSGTRGSLLQKPEKRAFLRAHSGFIRGRHKSVFGDVALERWFGRSATLKDRAGKHGRVRRLVKGRRSLVRVCVVCEIRG